MNDISRIKGAAGPLTLAGVPTGFLPWLMTDLARAATKRAVFIATDEAEMRGVADTAHWFAPEVRVLTFPAWDCLPYDRASPSLRVTSERMATLSALQDKVGGPRLLVTTVNAASQRTLTPFRLRQLVAKLAPGERIDRDDLAKLLQANGYVRTETVADAGDYAVRGSLVDLFPSGMEHALRLDFFGDEIESIRSFDPADQRTIGPVEGFTLLPASESLIDEESIKRFRSRYRETFGATATGDPLYQAISEGRRLAGMDHWLPLFEDKLATFFDHIGADDIIVRDAGSPGAVDARFEGIGDYHGNRVRAASSDPGSYRPLPADALYLTRQEWDGLLSERRAHLVSGFHEPGSANVLDFGIDGPRDFGAERSRSENVYEALADYRKSLEKTGLVLASYSAGSRQRLAGLVADHGLTDAAMADDWQHAQALAAKGKVALAVVPLERGFVAPALAVVTEQDLLGDPRHRVG